MILYAKDVDDDIQAYSPQVSCDAEMSAVNATVAEDDFNLGGDQLGYMYCFCK